MCLDSGTATDPFLHYNRYYYDTETGFYYLQSRYYDPSIGRFINADSFASTGQSFLGYNMFAYCNNNPANVRDPSGEFGITALCFMGAVAGAAINYAAEVIHNHRKGLTGYNAWIRDVNWSGVVSSAFSGALSAIPGAGIGTKAVDIVGSTAIEHGLNFVCEKMSKRSAKLDRSAIVTDLVINVATSFVPVEKLTHTGDLPQFIRHIKREARAINIKGTRKLNVYLNVKQTAWITINSFFSGTFSQLADTHVKPWVASLL